MKIPLNEDDPMPDLKTPEEALQALEVVIRRITDRVGRLFDELAEIDRRVSALETRR